MPAFKDYTGKKIGRVSVLGLCDEKSRRSRWSCLCDCGVEFTCWPLSFRRGERFECKGCMLERRRGVDLTGRVFGRWTVLGRVIDEHGKTKWKCRCDCGAMGEVATCALGKRGRSQSCGCLGRKEKSKYVNTTLYPPVHKLSQTCFYRMRVNLVHRCYNEKHQSYKLYGAEGITVCELWRNSAKDMYEWALSQGWQESDVFFLRAGEKEYNPETTVVMSESAFRSDLGTHGGHQITYNGETHSVGKWAKILQVSPAALRKKLLRNPSIDIVFNSHFRKCPFVRDITLRSKAADLYQSGLSQAAVARELGVSPAAIRYHLLCQGVELRPKRKTSS